MSRERVALIHGVGLDGSMWEPLREYLEPEYDVQVLELLGHGQRPPARDGITLAELAADVAGRLEPNTHLVGFSLGALVAQHVARFRPDLVASLVSVASVCDRTSQEHAAVMVRLASAASDFPATVEASIERWYPEESAVPAALIDATREVLQRNDPKSFLACYRVFATADAEIAPELPDISVPSHAVTGELDPGSTPEMSARLAAAIPGCTYSIIPAARHMMPVERPQELAHTLTAFIKEHSNVR
ncbi:alpha/beta fold hydrolase [Pseudarthrobacter sp. NIBRBAC000502770]|uniref:alpha/beta fold hydrolase n=1 Tax=Pseudarthrobacter sp. NIBRBAC000502770 TaxID=2590785 RepID=UPI00113FFAC8|nr:alpha/beta fold hydrolase [Pseudarthrobacter sp. NIBRBAC000502770]QDG90264.1 alpha/beta fold hydrolase [Pseudarthrobacter sp. NIBRBAC000502770]